MELNKYIDHTLLKADANKEDIINLCKEAMEYNFATVCVNPTHVKLAAEILKGSDVGITSVVGFPLGASTTDSKVFETKNAIENGATEIDMVINVGAIKDKNWDLVLFDMQQVKKVAKNSIVKVILENCLLKKDEIIKACELAVEAKLDFVKTSTGFSTNGAIFEDVKLMKETIKDKALVKAAGGIRSYEDAIRMIESGASRLGTSGGIAIIKGQKNDKSY
ncbi:deoxyribose-phosphate aldolase [Spiroplasma helicoides]|uniref:Deoxyribose-phosphate aldolase n=1 Tax=Spiroplasma helicoides TaxID=216938 RepID=A0A1B3SKV6_9MOLU|nr:deoxyribose-phosphate aldolase [Spiroplasma helicoides]AOG60555.1 deoxyribose-phosphate aldolase [Spiroplasma helicoides]